MSDRIKNTILSRDGICPFCKKNEIDGNCVLKAIWEFKEDRFEVNPCIHCWDALQHHAHFLIAKRKLKDFSEIPIGHELTTQLFTDNDVLDLLRDEVIPLWLRYREIEPQ